MEEIYKFTHGIYECEKELLAKIGDFEQWLYKVKNSKTGNAFQYKVAITDSALVTEALRQDIQSTVDTKGDYLVKKWLDKNREEKIQAWVETKWIKSRTLSMTDKWIEWEDF